MRWSVRPSLGWFRHIKLPVWVSWSSTDVVEGYLTALGKELEDIHIELLTGYFKLLESTPVALR